MRNDIDTRTFGVKKNRQLFDTVFIFFASNSRNIDRIYSPKEIRKIAGIVFFEESGSNQMKSIGNGYNRFYLFPGFISGV